MRYTKKADDVQYRKVNTANLKEEDFHNFTSNDVDYPEGVVIEVRRQNGTTHIEYGLGRKKVSINHDGNCLYFPLDLPTARLWLKDLTGIYYKVPMELREQDGNAYVLIPEGVRQTQLCGDSYFEAVYELIIK